MTDLLLEVAVQEVDLSVHHLGQAGPSEAWAMVEAADLAAEAGKWADRPVGSGLDQRAEGVAPSVLIRRPEGHTFELVGHPDGMVDVFVEVCWRQRVFGLLPVAGQLGGQVADRISLDVARGLFERFAGGATADLRAWVGEVDGAAR